MVEWQVRPYQKGDECQIVDMYNLDFKLDSEKRGEETRRQYSLDDWLWQFENNPYGFLTIVAEHREKIVGVMSSFYMDMKIGNRTIRSSQASGLFVHPDYRKQGMFLAIGRTMFEIAQKIGIQFSIGFPNEPAYRGHIQYGWFEASMLPVMSTYFDISKSVKAKGIPLSSIVSRLMNYYYARKRRHKIPQKDLEIKEISRFDERVNHFWNRVLNNHSMITVRDSKYLNWRYFDKPNSTYEVYVAENNGQIEGYLVTNKLQNESYSVGWIIDVLCISKGVFLNLVHYAVDHLQKYSMDSIKCLMNNNKSEYKWIQETGFTSYPRPKLRMIARINSEEVADSFRIYSKDWYVTYGDCDFM
jgi:GNAT superfamily N-acetyltransferase